VEKIGNLRAARGLARKVLRKKEPLQSILAFVVRFGMNAERERFSPSPLQQHVSLFQRRCPKKLGAIGAESHQILNFLPYLYPSISSSSHPPLLRLSNNYSLLPPFLQVGSFSFISLHAARFCHCKSLFWLRYLSFLDKVESKVAQNFILSSSSSSANVHRRRGERERKKIRRRDAIAQ